jgi:hypothetical protein
MPKKQLLANTLENVYNFIIVIYNTAHYKYLHFCNSLQIV